MHDGTDATKVYDGTDATKVYDGTDATATAPVRRTARIRTAL
ncbi:hypothetical protein [Streptomyces sp. NPDC050485]